MAQLTMFDKSYLQALEPPVADSGRPSTPIEADGILASLHRGEAPVVAYRIIAGQRYPLSARTLARHLEYGFPTDGLVYVERGDA